MPNPVKQAIAKRKPEQSPRQFSAPFTPHGTNLRTIGLRKLAAADPTKASLRSRLRK